MTDENTTATTTTTTTAEPAPTADPATATTAAEQPVANKEAEEVKEEEETMPADEEKEPVASSKQQQQEEEGEDPAEAKAAPAAEAEASPTPTPAETPAVGVELSEEDTKAKEAIVERLSFFFSDANVRQDTFVRKLLMDKSTGGTVPLDVLMRFNTIKKHSSKLEVLISAAKDLKLKDTLKVDETNLTVRRVVPFTPQNMKENIPKSLYLQNLPLVPVDGGDKDKTEQKEGEGGGEEETKKDDAADVVKKYDVTVDEIRNAFEKYGKVVIVKLKFGNAPPPHGHNNNRNNHNHHHPHRGNRGNNYGPKIPLGEAMVEFETLEGQRKAAEATLTIKDGENVEPRDVIKFGSTGAAVPVQVKLLSEWIDELRKNRDNDRKNNNNKKRSRDEDDEEEPLPTYEYDWKPGCVIRLMGLPEDSCDREAILDAVAKGLEIDVDEVKSRKIYADYSRGQANGAIRFLTPDEGIATLARKLKDGNIKIGSSGENGHQVSDAVILDGDEEKAYWQNFMDFKTKQLQEKEREKRAKKKRQKRGGGGGGGRGGHHRGGHRGGGGRGGGGGGHGHYGRDRKDRR
mmetsp:Transcript_22497/g.53129  ORF Transcript_22497/g.53129 Transcript_22497/m.53129 type:complete len:573 (+) Transcript_22497:94-1812(+)